MTTSFEKLEARPVLETARRLTDRIGARFPERGLHRVARELTALTEEVATAARHQHRRLRLVRDISRALAATIIALVAVALGFAAQTAFTDRPDGLDWVPLVESTVNDLVFVAIAVAVLYSAPERLQRSSALELLHRLRSLAHIIDMHQLTKDPERLRESFRRTEASPVMDLLPDELEHYLEYCSELLSLVGKAAALCAEESHDSVVLDTVSTIETLTVGMSRKSGRRFSYSMQSATGIDITGLIVKIPPLPLRGHSGHGVMGTTAPIRTVGTHALEVRTQDTSTRPRAGSASTKRLITPVPLARAASG